MNKPDDEDPRCDMEEPACKQHIPDPCPDWDCDHEPCKSARVHLTIHALHDGTASPQQQKMAHEMIVEFHQVTSQMPPGLVEALLSGQFQVMGVRLPRGATMGIASLLADATEEADKDAFQTQTWKHPGTRRPN